MGELAAAVGTIGTALGTGAAGAGAGAAGAGAAGAAGLGAAGAAGLGTAGAGAAGLGAAGAAGLGTAGAGAAGAGAAGLGAAGVGAAGLSAAGAPGLGAAGAGATGLSAAGAKLAGTTTVGGVLGNVAAKGVEAVSLVAKPGVHEALSAGAEAAAPKAGVFSLGSNMDWSKIFQSTLESGAQSAGTPSAGAEAAGAKAGSVKDSVLALGKDGSIDWSKTLQNAGKKYLDNHFNPKTILENKLNSFASPSGGKDLDVISHIYDQAEKLQQEEMERQRLWNEQRSAEEAQLNEQWNMLMSQK